MKHEKHCQPLMVLKLEVEGEEPRNAGASRNQKAKNKILL